MADAQPVPVKATKAHFVAIATLLGVPLAMMGFGEMPPPETIADAAVMLATAGITAGVNWLVTYYTTNHPKPAA